MAGDSPADVGGCQVAPCRRLKKHMPLDVLGRLGEGGRIYFLADDSAELVKTPGYHLGLPLPASMQGVRTAPCHWLASVLDRYPHLERRKSRSCHDLSSPTPWMLAPRR